MPDFNYGIPAIKIRYVAHVRIFWVATHPSERTDPQGGKYSDKPDPLCLCSFVLDRVHRQEIVAETSVRSMK